MKLKNNIMLVFAFSIVVKGIGAVIEIVIQWLLTQEIGVSGYGNYSFYVNCVDISFWALFSGVVKCNTFYLSDEKQSLTNYKKKYFSFYVIPLLIGNAAICLALKKYLLLSIIPIVFFQLLMSDKSSTYMARGSYNIALIGEYVLGRAVLLIGLFCLGTFVEFKISYLLLMYGIQYVAVVLFFFLFHKKIDNSESQQVSVPIKKLLNYQQSDIVFGLIGQAPVILQYIFVGAFEAGFSGIVSLVRKMVGFISGPTSKVFLPEFSRLYKERNYAELRYNYQMIMRIQMMFINVLGIVLIGNTEWFLSIFSPELLQYCTLFRVVSIAFLFAATLGPTTGLMQMTNNEAIDNMIRWGSVGVMILTWILLRNNSMFALIGMTVQVALEGVLKYGYVCYWFKRMPISIIRYVVMWMPITFSSILVKYCFAFQNDVAKVLFSVIIVAFLSIGIELTDKNMRNKIGKIFRKIKK